MELHTARTHAVRGLTDLAELIQTSESCCVPCAWQHPRSALLEQLAQPANASEAASSLSRLIKLVQRRRALTSNNHIKHTGTLSMEHDISTLTESCLKKNL